MILLQKTLEKLVQKRKACRKSSQEKVAQTRIDWKSYKTVQQTAKTRRTLRN